jgi:FkbM family methyltransferase
MTKPRVKLSRIFRRLKPSRQPELGVGIDPIPTQEKLGTRYGGWTVPVQLLNEGSICYCFGAGEDISFDVALIKRFGCQVYTFDPTPRSIEHVALLFEHTQQNRPTAVNNNPDVLYDVTQEDLKKLHFYDFGIWSENAIIKFYAPRNSEHVSHSILNLQQTSDYFEAQCFTLQWVMNTLGHNQLDLAKFDIEGAEYAVLGSIVKNGIRPRILCVEFGEGYNPQDKRYVQRIQDTITLLTNYGYRVTFRDTWDFTLVGTW